VAGMAEVMRWVQEAVEPVLLPRIEAYDVPPTDFKEGRRAIEQIVDEVYAKTVPECSGTTATRKVWKALWCEVVLALVKAGKIDEELDDVIALCMDDAFDPRVPKPQIDPPPPKPPLPPFPLPMDGDAGPMQGAAAGPPANVWTASSRQELSQLGVMRMLEGTAHGMPIMGPAARVVVLAFNPAWPGIGQARTDMLQHAAENPGLSFVEVSFADTQRHFGKPKDVYGIAWALTSAAPDGKVYAAPIVRNDPRDAPPTADHWNKVIAHASGYVGFGKVRTVVRPRRFGDCLRALATDARRSSTRHQPRPKSSKRPPGRPMRHRGR